MKTWTRFALIYVPLAAGAALVFVPLPGAGGWAKLAPRVGTLLVALAMLAWYFGAPSGSSKK